MIHVEVHTLWPDGRRTQAVERFPAPPETGDVLHGRGRVEGRSWRFVGDELVLRIGVRVARASGLETCPFCGGVATIRDAAPRRQYDPCLYLITCNDCGASGPPGETPDEAIEGWRRRPGTTG